MERYVKNIKKWFAEDSELDKIYDTSKLFPTHLSHCKNETWEKVLDHTRYRHVIQGYNEYFIPATEQEYIAQEINDCNEKSENHENLIKLLKEIKNK